MANYVDQFEDDDADDGKMSFLDHLEALRWHLLRSVVAVIVLMIACFIGKSFIFDYLILGPTQPSFATYRFFCYLSKYLPPLDSFCTTAVSFQITNITMTGQFFQHLAVSFIGGLIGAFPYVIWELWRFFKPGLKANEINAATGIIFYVSLLFFIGVLFGYYVLAPLSIVFLGNYQVSLLVANQITLESYISTLTNLTLASGLVFELPILAYFLGKIGIVSAAFLQKYRKHSVLVNFFIASIVTPGDVGSTILMSFPLMILYEISILVVKRVEKNKLSN